MTDFAALIVLVLSGAAVVGLVGNTTCLGPQILAGLDGARS